MYVRTLSLFHCPSFRTRSLSLFLRLCADNNKHSHGHSFNSFINRFVTICFVFDRCLHMFLSLSFVHNVSQWKSRQYENKTEQNNIISIMRSKTAEFSSNVSAISVCRKKVNSKYFISLRAFWMEQKTNKNGRDGTNFKWKIAALKRSGHWNAAISHSSSKWIHSLYFTQGWGDHSENWSTWLLRFSLLSLSLWANFQHIILFIEHFTLVLLLIYRTMTLMLIDCCPFNDCSKYLHSMAFDTYVCKYIKFYCWPLPSSKLIKISEIFKLKHLRIFFFETPVNKSDWCKCHQTLWWWIMIVFVWLFICCCCCFFVACIDAESLIVCNDCY